MNLHLKKSKKSQPPKLSQLNQQSKQNQWLKNQSNKSYLMMKVLKNSLLKKLQLFKRKLQL
jgi:hypothetical protein